MKRIYFFATRGDIEPVLTLFEADGRLCFALDVNNTSPPQENFTSVSQIPNVGFSRHESAIGGDCYLVTSFETPAKPVKFTGIGGETRWTFDHSMWPNSVMMRLGGLWLGETLLPGLVDTLHDTSEAQGLMKRFLKSLKKEGFKKVDEFWVGREAMEMLKSGRRLSTTAHQSPSEFDLRIL